MDIEALKYPIGKYKRPEVITPADLEKWIGEIAALPAQMRQAVAGLTPSQMDTPYREGGWSLRQVVHHVPDSHMNAYIRFKWALTEETPVIKAYHEDRWAQLPDSQQTPVTVSLGMLEHLHERWVHLLKSMKPEEFQRKYFHPEQKKEVSLDGILGMYAWHGKHHTAHITGLRERMS